MADETQNAAPATSAPEGARPQSDRPQGDVLKATALKASARTVALAATVVPAPAARAVHARKAVPVVAADRADANSSAARRSASSPSRRSIRSPTAMFAFCSSSCPTAARLFRAVSPAPLPRSSASSPRPSSRHAPSLCCPTPPSTRRMRRTLIRTMLSFGHESEGHGFSRAATASEKIGL